MENEPTDAPLPALTRTQDAFAREFALSGHGTKSALAAGYSPVSAYSTASENLKKPEILAAVSHYEKPLVESYKAKAEAAGLTVQRVLRETARIAFFDPRKLFDAEGQPLRPADLDDDTAAAIRDFELDDAGRIMSFRAWDKGQALDRATKILGLFEQDNAQQNPITALLASLGKSSFPVTR